MSADNGLNFWFNRKTGLVEEGQQSLGLERLGPFATRTEAEKALETLAKRARIARAEDDSEWFGHHS